MIQLVMFAAFWNPIIPPPMMLTFDPPVTLVTIADQPAPIQGSGHVQ